MAGTVLDDIELIIEEIHGNGGGKPPSHDGDDGGDEGGGSREPEPRGSKARMYSAAVVVGMVSILVFFLVLTAAFVFLRAKNFHTWSGVPLPRILWFNTIVLLASSATLEIARRRLNTNEIGAFRRMWMLTTVLGLVFVSGQIVAWTQLAESGVYLTSRLASGFFYVFTALHAAHLIGGICALLYVGLRKFDGRVSRPLAANVASYYWHFMDGLWVFLLALLYFGQ
jgi:cytochrome c oxidase subunit 3